MKNFLLCLALLATAALRAQTFSATVNELVPDDATSVYFTIEVSGLPDVIDATFGLEQVCINLNHTWNADMEARLIAPDGSAFMLFSGVGGDGDNFENCCLRGDAPEPIYNFGAPFTGVFRPMGLLGTVNNGQNPNGAWRLVLNDTYAFADQGFLIDWSISFGNSPAPPFPFVSSQLPIAKITTGGKAILNEPKTEALLQIIHHGNGQPNFYTDTDYEYEGKILVELQGFTGPYYPKKNFDFDLIDNEGEEIDTSLLGMPAENDWIFKAEYLDVALMRNAVSYEFARRMGRYAPRTRYCELFLDGEYQGVYNLTEKVKRDKNRVDIARLTPQDTSGTELTGGYIIEMNHNGAPGAWDSEYLPINFASCNLPVQFKHVYPRDEEIRPQQAAYIHAYVDTFEHSLHEPGFADPDTGYRRWIDETTFIDFMLVNEFSTNYDSYGRSTFMYKEKITDGGKLKIGPAWDYDRAYCCVDGWVWELTHPGWPFPDWWAVFHTDSLFLKQERCRWNELRADAWATQEFVAYIDSLQALIGDAGPRNFQRWPELWVSDYNEQVNNLKAVLLARLDWMDAQLPPAICLSATTLADIPQDVVLYPNPAHDRAFLRTASGCTASIRDITGRLILQTDIEAGVERPIELHNWPPGVYTVECRGENGRWIGKLVVE